MDKTSRLRELKQDIYDIHRSYDNNDDFVNLITNKKIDPELLQSIIVLHNSYKADIQHIKNFSLRCHTGVLDYLSAMETEKTMKIMELETQIKKIEHSRGSKIERYIMWVIIIIAFLFGLFGANSDAAKGAVESLGHVKDIVTGINSGANTTEGK